MQTDVARKWDWGLLGAVAWFVVYVIARAVLEHDGLSNTVRVLVALAPVIPFALFLSAMIRGVAAMDELERRIHLEALAVAFPLTVLGLMVLGLLELAITLNPDDWSYRHVWQLTPLVYFAGLVRARLRYR